MSRMSKRRAMTQEDWHKATILANEHWAWLQTLLEKIYKDAFIHGYKHGREGK